MGYGGSGYTRPEHRLISKIKGKLVTRLEDLKNGTVVKGVILNQPVELISVGWTGNQVINIIFRYPSGAISEMMLHREDENRLEIIQSGRVWSFDAGGEMFRLVTEANRINLAHYFDPYLAIHTSLVEPLPHQITAVYGEMISRQPLRFLLADDPGAGKTIMAGLLMKELIARGDLERCLVVAPGNLVEQWQDELSEKFNLKFDILSRETIATQRSRNPFREQSFLIARLDMLARNEELQERLEQSEEWDLIVCDEAHRMSATYTGGEIRYTRRYQVGRKLGGICRHLLLMTATPHNGKEEDFQLFMALLDSDRFEGRFRDGVHHADTKDMMRRLTKEELLKFDGRRLFPERKARTVKYELSMREANLYADVTEYVREEMNRVRRFAKTDGKRRNNVGFALQILQRRLASSPAAIYSSLQRRRERLENELTKAHQVTREKRVMFAGNNNLLSKEDFEDFDEYSQGKVDELEDLIATVATTAETVEQLALEVEILRSLESKALEVLESGEDTKWTELNRILDEDLMTDNEGNRRKLIIFTEPKDTLHYLVRKIRARFGKPDTVGEIHGGIDRKKRQKTIESFMHDKDLLVLVANDAAGEGVNLQRGHLMVNYDLPWNPNKIEQRFGRIHRIGQTEVCHLWNLVAADTREGEVYARLLEKLETARDALGGRVYDVLGELFEGIPLKDLLFEAIQYGEQKDVKAKLFEKIDGAVDQEHLLNLLRRRALTNDTMPEARVDELRREMEQAKAQRLQPHHIQSFFIAAFRKLGGRIKAREKGRWEITHVPVPIKERNQFIGTNVNIQGRYERICFEKTHINQQPVAEFVCPGHPLLESVISLICQQYDYLMKQGAILVDDTDAGENISAIFFMEHSVQDGRMTKDGKPRVISQKLQFVSINAKGDISNAGIAPHLNLRPTTDEEGDLVKECVEDAWLSSDLEKVATNFATTEIVPTHLAEVKTRRIPEIKKVEQEVKARLEKEINFWDGRAFELREQEKAGKNVRLSSENAQRRADELAGRLRRRRELLEQEKFISAQPPKIRGGMVVLPMGLLDKIRVDRGEVAVPPDFAKNAISRREVEFKAMDAVMSMEKELGNEPEDVSEKKIGYDILSVNPNDQTYRFIEVKGRVVGGNEITVTRQEIITSLHAPDEYILAIVFVEGEFVHTPCYIRKPFNQEPEFGITASQVDLKTLLERAETPT